MKRGKDGFEMRAIYVRSMLAVFGIAAFVLIETLLPQEASADPSAPAAVIGAGHRLR